MLDKKILIYSTLVIVGIYFLLLGLAKAQSFLAPLTTAIILSLMILPVANKMENRIKRIYSSMLNTIILFLLSLGLVALLSLQIKSFVDDWPKIEETMKPKVEQLKTFITNNTPLKEKDLSVQGQSEGDSSSSSTASAATGGKMAVSLIGQTFSAVGVYLLTFIYIFFLLNYRHRFKEFLFRLFPDDQKGEVDNVIHESANVVQNYLVGKFIMIVLLAVLYSIGLGVSGVNNFILLSIIAAFFDLIPYIGNIIAFALAMAFGYLITGSTGTLIGIIITFSVAQFVQSYILQPYVVGDKVDLHPFIVILVVIIGNAIWGVIGMILAIPIMAVITIVFLHVPPLKPFGFLFSNEEA